MPVAFDVTIEGLRHRSHLWSQLEDLLVDCFQTMHTKTGSDLWIGTTHLLQDAKLHQLILLILSHLADTVSKSIPAFGFEVRRHDFCDQFGQFRFREVVGHRTMLLALAQNKRVGF